MTAVPAPTLLLVTDRTQTGDRPLPDIVEACVDAGIRHVFLRERDLPTREYADLFARLRHRIGDRATILTRTPIEGADGCQLRDGDSYPPRPPALVGRSVHDVDGVRRSAGEATDYVLAGPFAATCSKPGYGPPLGPDGIRRLTQVAGAPPLLAIGGIQPADAADLATAGAHGLAVMGPLMRAADPAGLAAEYVRVTTVFVR